MTEQNYKVYNATQQEDHTTRLTYEEAVELAVCYYTEWEDEDDYEWEEINGELIEL